MNILITGATGYIGKKLCIKLAEKGHTVHALYRSEEKTNSLSHPNVKWFKGDIMDVLSIERAIHSCQTVFHLAAYAKVWAKDPEMYNRINVQGTINVLNIAKKHGIEKVVFTSTAGVFGPSSDDLINESSQRQKDYSNEYETSKILAEQKIQAYIRNGLNVVILNPTRVFGPGEISDSNGVTKMIRLYCQGKFRWIPGDGESIGNYAYVDDVVEGHILALEKGRTGEQYILGGTNLSFNRFFELLAVASGLKLRMIKLSCPVMLFTAKLLMFRARLLGNPPLITPPWVKRYLLNWEVSSKKAIEELGYRITPMNKGLHKTLTWLHNGQKFNE